MASAARTLLLARLRPIPAAVASSCHFLRPLAASTRSPLPVLPCLSPNLSAAISAAAVIIRGFATQIEKPLDTSDRPPKVSSPHYSCAGSDPAPIEDTTSYGIIRDSEHKQIIVTSDGSCHENITTDDDGGSYSEVSSDDEDFSYEEMPRAGVRETRVMPGCDFNHWLVVMYPPPGDPSNPDVPRDEIIDGYVKTLAQVVGSEEEARQKIYSVSTRHYFAFGALVSEELSLKLKELPKVRWVLADSYLHAENKDYGGEPFINGEAVPYDPKYHEEWVKNIYRDNETTRRRGVVA